jgi:hypothetical protein
VKVSKSFRKQAAKAERMARAVNDCEMSERFFNLAKAYRSSCTEGEGKPLQKSEAEWQHLRAPRSAVGPHRRNPAWRKENHLCTL